MDAETRAKALRDIVLYILNKYHTELGYSDVSKQWVGQLTARSEATGNANHKLAYGVIRQIMNGMPANRTDATLGKLARILSTKPVIKPGPDGLVQRDPKTGHILASYETIKQLNGLDAPQLRLRSLEEFKNWEQNIAADSNAFAREPAEQVIEYKLVVPHRQQVRITRDRDEVHYVTYRYAFDDSPRFPQIAREVLTFTHSGGIHNATMSYKIGNNDRHLRLFKGPVIPLGQSRMCVMTSTDQIPDDWAPEDDRGRVLFMRRDSDKGMPIARFGILSSTRSIDGAPCSACLVMLLIDAKIQDIQEYRRRVTLVASEESILAHDFGGLPDLDIQRIKLFLENSPNPYKKLEQSAGAGGAKPIDGYNWEMYADDNAEFDMALRLHILRFKKHMSEICRKIQEMSIKNPITKRWNTRGALLAD